MSKLKGYYPDAGPLRRELYPKHLAFFRAGVDNRERLALCANRTGKTEGMGGFETTCHLTGLYPDWWEGRRFDKPISAWASGTTHEKTRDILQKKLLGPVTALGTGLIPGDTIGRHLAKPGVPDGIAMVHIRHVTEGEYDGESLLVFKSYDQKREGFEGEEQDVIWLDEEPPMDIYVECLTRTMTNNGLIMLTFTPLEGLSDVVLSFLPGGTMPAESQPDE